MSIIYITDIEEIFNNFLNSFEGNKQKYYSDLDDDIVRNYELYEDQNNVYVKKACDVMIKKIDNKYLCKMRIWKICLTKNNFMFGNPFTLEDVIFMPIKHLNNKSIIKTYIHEKIHICQRYKNNLWNEYVQSHTPWRLCKMRMKQKIYNPDTYYKKFYYLGKDGKNYYTVLDDDFNVVVCDEAGKKIDVKMQYEHPYEELAYKLSECIMI